MRRTEKRLAALERSVTGIGRPALVVVWQIDGLLYDRNPGDPEARLMTEAELADIEASGARCARLRHLHDNVWMDEQ